MLCVLGEVEGRDCVLVDDLVSTGGTLIAAAESLRKAGAESVSAVFTHAVMSSENLELLCNAPLERIVTTNTIPFPPHPRVETVSIVPPLAEAIRGLFGSVANRLEQGQHAL